MRSFLEYFCCPERFACFRGNRRNSSQGFFRFGTETLYGSCTAQPASSPDRTCYDAVTDTTIDDGIVHLPFDPSETIDNLRLERYVSSSRKRIRTGILKNIYYLARPLLHLSLRKRLQRAFLNGWRQLAFPEWPVDVTVDRVFQNLLQLSMKANRVERIPFIWFWPDAAPSCAMMTHDVETVKGKHFCSTLMDIDDAYGIKASFQIVPEKRYSVSHEFIQMICERDFEVNIQDLNHDGLLFKSHEQFLSRATSINAYAREFGVSGFRSAVLYRRQEWLSALDCSYDMSVPNVAHLDPQRGGCCTVMPYFNGKTLELPVTTTQDYSLFHILGDYSNALWTQQIEIIQRQHGLISFIVHPDYITSHRARAAYEKLLIQLTELRRRDGVWIATPSEINEWWRQRRQMRIVEHGQEFRVEGPGSERARVAFAYEQDGHISFDRSSTALQVAHYA